MYRAMKWQYRRAAVGEGGEKEQQLYQQLQQERSAMSEEEVILRRQAPQGPADGKRTSAFWLFVLYLIKHPSAAWLLFLLTLMYMNSQYCRYVYGVALVPFVDYDGGAYALLAGPIFTVVTSMSGVLLGLLGEIRKVRMLTLATIVWSISIGAVAFATAFWQVAFTRVGLGLGQSAFTPFAASIISDHFSARWRGAAVGIFSVAIYGGYTLALSVGSVLTNRIGYEAAYLSAGIFGLVLALLLLLTVNDKKRAVVGGTLLTTSASRVAMAVKPAAGDCEQQRQEAQEEQEEDGGGGGDGGEGRGGGEVNGDNSYTCGRRSVNRESRGECEREHSDLSALCDCGGELWSHWMAFPSLFVLSLVGGLRNSAGAIWGAYTAIFFSPLYLRMSSEDQSYTCSFSYNPHFHCSGTISHLGLAVPMPGTASIDGDMGQNWCMRSLRMCPSEFPWCDVNDGSCFKLFSTPWHDVGLSHNDFEVFQSWVPVVCGGLPSVFGGVLSDRLVQWYGPAARLAMITISTLLSAPFMAGMLLAPYPWCFICLMFGYLFGEMWYGAFIALVIDLVPKNLRASSLALFYFFVINLEGAFMLLVPILQRMFTQVHTFIIEAQPLATASNAVFSLTTTMTTTAPLSLLSSFHTYTGNVSDLLHSHSGGGSDGDIGGGPLPADGASEAMTFTVTQDGSKGLQMSLLVLYPGLYVVSVVLGFLALPIVRRDSAKMSKEQTFLSSSSSSSLLLMSADCGERQSSPSAATVFVKVQAEGEGEGGGSSPGGEYDDGREEVDRQCIISVSSSHLHPFLRQQQQQQRRRHVILQEEEGETTNDRNENDLRKPLLQQRQQQQHKR